MKPRYRIYFHHSWRCEDYVFLQPDQSFIVVVRLIS
jgi:hypothetical protein